MSKSTFTAVCVKKGGCIANGRSIRYYLSERFRLRFEDSGIEEMMDENGELSAEAADALAKQADGAPPDEGVDVSGHEASHGGPEADPTFMNIRTLDGDVAGDEFASDAINYQILLGKVDKLLERLKLDA
jgi:ankyrin repeat/BTB/POZ domain-containing protein 1